jgi:hypothetical protein
VTDASVPLKNHEGDAVGVLQLINARDPESGEVASFSEADQRLVESLTASERPYKKTMTQALTILGRTRLHNRIDPDLFDVFVREKVYLRYAERFLKSEQIDGGRRYPGPRLRRLEGQSCEASHKCESLLIDSRSHLY